MSNDLDANQLFRNNGDQTFTDVSAELNVQGPRPSFAPWFWDFNNDGALDLFVPSYPQSVDYVAADFIGIKVPMPGDALYQGNANGTFEDVGSKMNLDQVTIPMGSNFGDLDNDGYLDYYLGTGYPEYDALMPNVMVRNKKGTGFANVTMAGGFGHLQKGHGIAFADLDNDGDQDVFMEVGGWFVDDAFSNALYENPGFGNNWITIKLIGKRSNRSSIGAKLRLLIEENGKERMIYRWVNSGSSFGGNPFRQEIGVGQADIVKELEITWPFKGSVQTFRSIPVNQFIVINEGADGYESLSLKKLEFGRTEAEAHEHTRHH